MSGVVTNAGLVAREFYSMAEAADDESVAGLRRAATRAVSRLRTESPRDTGKLARAWDTDNTPDGADVENRSGYAAYVNNGSLVIRAGDIVSSEVDAELDRIANEIIKG